MIRPNEVFFFMRAQEHAKESLRRITEHRTIPATLYHYTGQAGLLGMLGSRLFRATDVRFMNDALEFRYAINIALKAIDDTPSALDHPLMPGLRQEVIDVLSSRTGADTFAVCFSASRDQLSQWRGYMKSGSGFSIGFPFPFVRQLSESNKQDTTFQPCIYDPTEQHGLSSEWLSEVSRLIQENWRKGENVDPLMSDAVAVEIANLFTGVYAPFFKHPAFKEENEWRLIFVDSEEKGAKKREFREGLSSLVPYVEIPLGRRRIELTEVIVGPTPLPELSVEATRTFLAGVNINQRVPVVITQNPYRGW